MHIMQKNEYKLKLSFASRNYIPIGSIIVTLNTSACLEIFISPWYFFRTAVTLDKAFYILISDSCIAFQCVVQKIAKDDTEICVVDWKIRRNHDICCKWNICISC